MLDDESTKVEAGIKYCNPSVSVCYRQFDMFILVVPFLMIGQWKKRVTGQT